MAAKIPPAVLYLEDVLGQLAHYCENIEVTWQGQVRPPKDCDCVACLFAAGIDELLTLEWEDRCNQGHPFGSGNKTQSENYSLGSLPSNSGINRDSPSQDIRTSQSGSLSENQTGTSTLPPSAGAVAPGEPSELPEP